MNKITLQIGLLITSIIISFSVKADDNVSVLKNYDLSGQKLTRTFLTGSLNEISGIAFTPDGRLFGHHDEAATIYEIDRQTGTIIKWFNVGEYLLRADFEDIVIIGVTFYLVTSDGVLFRFYEQKNRGYSQYDKFSTGLTSQHNVEGLCYDPVNHTLLLACKGGTEKQSGYKYVYTFDLNTKKLLSEPRFKISVSEIKKSTGIKDFSPSGIEWNPSSGSFFVLSANEKAVIELSPGGKLLAGSKLQKNIHRQPEGITFGCDSTLYISDEGGKLAATLTSYPVLR